MADPTELNAIMDEFKLDLSKELKKRMELLKTDKSTFQEVVITSDSPLVGRSRTYLRRRSSNQLTLMAVARQGKPIHKRLGNIQFMIGDVLLLHSGS